MDGVREGRPRPERQGGHAIALGRDALQ